MIRKISSVIAFAVLCFGYAFLSWASLVITSPSSLPDAVKGEFYTFQLEAEGAVGDVVWEIETGEMEYVEVETPHHFAGTASAVQIMDHHGGMRKMELPFVFPYYGRGYRKMRIGEAGIMGPLYARLGSPSASGLRGWLIMAPFWRSWFNSGLEGVYAEAVPWRFVLTWRGRKSGSQTDDINYQGIIYPSGEIEFNYGDGNQALDPVIGISGGDNEHYVISVKNRASDLDRAPSSRFMLSALPPKLELHAGAGIISGTPEQCGLFAFRVAAQDLGSPDPAVSKVFSIAVPGLLIHSRRGGVFIRRGEANPISWGGTGIGDRVTVKLYRIDQNLETILDNAPNEEGVLWQPPDEYPLCDDCSVLVKDNNNPPFIATKPLTIWDNDVLVPQCCETVQEAVDFAREGDTILIAPGTYVEHLVVKKKITLAGAGGGETVLDGGASRCVLTVINAEGVTIRDLTVAYAAGEVHGGIYCANSTVSIERCTIHGSSAVFGGGVFLDECSATLRDCRIEGNTAEKNGGGVYIWQSRALIDGCVITGNSAEEGGGLFCWYSAPRIVRTVVAKNTATVGGGIVCDEAFPMIVNCTIADNASARKWSGGLHCMENVPTFSVPRIMSSIIWGNRKGISGASRVEIEFCDTEDASYAGVNDNLSENPLFVNTEEGDYGLAPGSPCIDFGNPDPAYDDDDGTRCDMGAFGGAGYVREWSVITHFFSEWSRDIVIYWLAASLKDFVLQIRRRFEEPWSEGTPLDAGEPYRDSGVLPAERSRFYRILPVE